MTTNALAATFHNFVALRDDNLKEAGEKIFKF